MCRAISTPLSHAPPEIRYRLLPGGRPTLFGGRPPHPSTCNITEENTPPVDGHLSFVADDTCSGAFRDLIFGVHAASEMIIGEKKMMHARGAFIGSTLARPMPSSRNQSHKDGRRYLASRVWVGNVLCLVKMGLLCWVFGRWMTATGCIELQ